jgi:hypothetical protein
MKIVNPLWIRRITRTMKPCNTILLALKERRASAGVHLESSGALRYPANMAVIGYGRTGGVDEHA